MSAIDFQALRKAERRKQRDKKKQQQQQQLGDESTNAPSSTSATHNPNQDTPPPTVPPWDSSDPIQLVLPAWTTTITTQDDDDETLLPITDPAWMACHDPPHIIVSRRSVLPEETSSSSSSLEERLVAWLDGWETNSPPLPALVRHESESETARRAHGRWTVLPHAQRRVALWDARLQAFPPPLQTLVDQLQTWYHERAPAWLQSSNLLVVDHVLINDYTDAGHGILPHTDGPAYFPVTLTLSLLSPAVMEFTPRNVDDDNNTSKSRRQAYLAPGSLVVFSHQAYADWMHAIPPHRVTITASESINRDDAAAAAVEPEELSDETIKDSKTNKDEVVVLRGPRRISLTFRMKYPDGDKSVSS